MGSKSIITVKEEWEKRLMAIPGVFAVGIGQTGDKIKCIKIYVSTEEAERKIPAEIEGYPVEVVKRKPLKPL